MPAFATILLTNLHAALAKQSALRVLPHLTYLINLSIRICGSGRGFLECNLQSCHPFLERRNRAEQLAVGRARPPPSSRQLSYQARPPLPKGWGLHLWPRSSRVGGCVAFSGSLAHPLYPSHLPLFHPSSRLPRGTQGHSNPPTTLANAAGGGKGAQLLGLLERSFVSGFFQLLVSRFTP